MASTTKAQSGAARTGPTFTLAAESNQDGLTQIHVTAPTVSQSTGSLSYSWTGMHSGATTFSTTGVGDTTTSTPTVDPTGAGPVTLRCAITDDNGTVTVEKVVCFVGREMEDGVWRALRLDLTAATFNYKTAGNGTHSVSGALTNGDDLDITVADIANADSLASDGSSLAMVGNSGTAVKLTANIVDMVSGYDQSTSVMLRYRADDLPAATNDRIRVKIRAADDADQGGVYIWNKPTIGLSLGVELVVATAQSDDNILTGISGPAAAVAVVKQRNSWVAYCDDNLGDIDSTMTKRREPSHGAAVTVTASEFSSTDYLEIVLTDSGGAGLNITDFELWA